MIIMLHKVIIIPNVIIIHKWIRRISQQEINTWQQVIMMNHADVDDYDYGRWLLHLILMSSNQ